MPQISCAETFTARSFDPAPNLVASTGPARARLLRAGADLAQTRAGPRLGLIATLRPVPARRWSPGRWLVQGVRLLAVRGVRA